MLVTMAAAALMIDAAFNAAGLAPQVRPSRSDIFSTIRVDYKLFLNILGLVIFASLFGLTMRRGATDPVCGMKVDRVRAVRVDHAGATYYVCSENCRARFEADPERYVTERAAQDIDASHAVDSGLAGAREPGWLRRLSSGRECH
jgi:YHS domain-containing protein